VGFANIKKAHRQDTRLGMTPDPLLDPGPTPVAKGQNAPFLPGQFIAMLRAGEKSGKLTPGQAQQLHREDHAIRKEEQHMAAKDGGIIEYGVIVVQKLLQIGKLHQ